MGSTEYKNARIEFEESSDPKVVIDGEPIQLSCDEEAGEFNTAELPYRTFGSAKELGEAVVVVVLPEGVAVEAAQCIVVVVQVLDLLVVKIK